MVDSIKKDGKLYISTEDVTDDLLIAGYEALTWTEIGRVVNFPDMGITTNMIDLEYINTDTMKRAKGFSDAGSSDITVGVDHDDVGQIELLEAGATGYKFARGFKMESNDALNATGTNTLRYSYGKVAGPNFAGGGGEDRDIETYTIGFEQQPIIDKATAGA